jgi:hypothetical protein
VNHGRNRLDAMEIAGIQIFDGDELLPHIPGYRFGDSTDPYEFVVSMNLHRRHLTSAQRRELIGKLIKTDPAKSDRQIAATAKVDGKTVAKVRRELELTAEIPQLEKTVGADGRGRKRPVKRRTVDDFVRETKELKAEADRKKATAIPEREGGTGSNPLIAAWDRAGPKQRREFVLERKTEIMFAQQVDGGMEVAKHEATGDGLDIPDYLQRTPKAGSAS